MPKPSPGPSCGATAIGAILLTAAAACNAQTCEELSAQIEAKIRASGVLGFTLKTIDAADTAAGRVVGTCGNGSKKITYALTPGNNAAAPARNSNIGGPAAVAALPGASAPPRARARSVPLLTECKDGTMAVGATCGR